MAETKAPTNEIAIIMPELVLPATIAELTPKQVNWLKFSGLKDKTVQDLSNGELVVQGFLLNIENEKDRDKVLAKIEQAKAELKLRKDQRLQFTRFVDAKVVGALIVHEQRGEELLQKALKHELTLRVAANTVATETSALTMEENRFKAHFKAENYRRAAEYRQLLTGIITKYYLYCLENKVPVRDVPVYKEKIIGELKLVKVPPATKFARQLITDAKAPILFAEVTPYVPADNLTNACTKELDEAFLMYENDLKKPAEAATQIKQQHEQQQQEVTKDVEANTSTINLIASAEVTIEAPNVKKILEVKEIENEAEAMALISAMKDNWNGIKPYLKNKSWAKLTLQQIADAIGRQTTETPSTKYAGITIIEKLK